VKHYKLIMPPMTSKECQGVAEALTDGLFKKHGISLEMKQSIDTDSGDLVFVADSELLGYSELRFFLEPPVMRTKSSIWEKILDYAHPISSAALMISLVANCIAISVLWNAI
jgi:hypothetical protein